MLKNWKRLAPFYFYGGVALLLGTAAAFGEGPSAGGIIILLILGFIGWGLFEYCLHRFIFHHDAKTARGQKLLYAAHIGHHDNPKNRDRFFSNLHFSAPIAAVIWLSLWVVLGSWRAASYFSIGVIAGYFSYEWLHFQAHHRRPRLRLFRYLKKYHLMHHYRSPKARFGVTSPLFDFVFGTYQPISHSLRAKPSSKA